MLKLRNYSSMLYHIPEALLNQFNYLLIIKSFPQPLCKNFGKGDIFIYSGASCRKSIYLATLCTAQIKDSNLKLLEFIYKRVKDCLGKQGENPKVSIFDWMDMICIVTGISYFDFFAKEIVKTYSEEEGERRRKKIKEMERKLEGSKKATKENTSLLMAAYAKYFETLKGDDLAEQDKALAVLGFCLMMQFPELPIFTKRGLESLKAADFKDPDLTEYDMKSASDTFGLIAEMASETVFVNPSIRYLFAMEFLSLKDRVLAGLDTSDIEEINSRAIKAYIGHKEKGEIMHPNSLTAFLPPLVLAPIITAGAAAFLGASSTAMATTALVTFFTTGFVLNAVYKNDFRLGIIKEQLGQDISSWQDFVLSSRQAGEGRAV